MSRDDKLIRKALEGDSAALNELIETYYPDILRYCLWHTPYREIAEDAAQETFLKFIRYFDGYVHKGHLRAFLYKIAQSCCADQCRKMRNRETSLDEMTAEYASDDSMIREKESEILFEQMVRKLPEEWKEAVFLKYGMDLSMREIADIMDIPMRTVQSRLRSALKKMRREM